MISVIKRNRKNKIDKIFTTIAEGIFRTGKRFCLIGAALLFIGSGMGKMKSFAVVSEKRDLLERQDGTFTYVSSELSCELEGEQEPPGYAELYLNTDMSEKRQELSFVGGKEQYREWKEGFCFPITVTGYDGDIFLLGDVEIAADSELLSYKEEFLKYLGLSEAYYQIDEIQWMGESYEREGTVYRDALARGKKLMRYVDARYGGNIRLSNTAKKEALAETEEAEEGSEIEKASPSKGRENEAAVNEQKLSLFDRLIRWFKEHLTVVSVSLLFLAAVVLSMRWLLKSKKEENRD